MNNWTAMKIQYECYIKIYFQLKSLKASVWFNYSVFKFTIIDGGSFLCHSLSGNIPMLNAVQHLGLVLWTKQNC